MNVRKQYNSLDLAKFIAAVLIIVLHTNPFASYSNLLTTASRSIITVIAVPFFFTVSGFLLFDKLNSLDEKEKGKYFKRYILRLFVMYLCWSAVYFIFVAISWYKNGFSVNSVLQYIKRFVFEGSYSTIWFLPALIVAACLVYFLTKRFSCKAVFAISLPFYLIACFGSSYYGLSEKIPVIREFYNAYYSFFDSVKNGLLFGFVFVALGAILACQSIEKKPIFYFLLSAVSFVFMAAETIIQAYLKLSTKGVDIKIMLIPLTYFLVVFVLSIDLAPKPVYIVLRKLSLLMFLSQRIFITLFEWYLSNYVFYKNSMLYFISILFLTVSFSFIFIKLSEKVKVLKKFY